jgi:hypothetical protein
MGLLREKRVVDAHVGISHSGILVHTCIAGNSGHLGELFMQMFKRGYLAVLIQAQTV